MNDKAEMIRNSAAHYLFLDFDDAQMNEVYKYMESSGASAMDAAEHFGVMH